MGKKKINELIAIVDTIMRDRADAHVSEFFEGEAIKKSYNGKVSAFGATVAISGLAPAVAMYYYESGTAVTTRPILEVIAKTINRHNRDTGATCPQYDAKGLTARAMSNGNDRELANLMLDCAVALKMVIRTYPLIQNE